MAQQTVNVLSGPTGRLGLNVGSLEVAADAGLSEKWANTGFEFLEVNNTSAGAITLTEVYNGNAVQDGVVTPNRTVSIAAGARMILGPFPTNLYNDSSNNMNITWSAAAGMKLAVFRISPNN